MIFTDPRLYVMGVGTGHMTELATGDVLYWSDKFQEANVAVSASDNILNAGIGNGPAIIIPTDPNITVNVTAGDFSEYVKAASVGAGITPGAAVMTCQQVTASGAALSIDVSGATPVAGPGMNSVVCYVQEVGAESPILTGGIAYALDPATGAITGFTAASGTSYLVTYYTAQANATMTTVTTNIKGKVVRFVFSQPVYTNFDPNTNSGDFWGWLHTIIPRLQLMPDGGSTTGSQSAYTTTGITGRALSYDETVVSGCEECGALGGAPLMYRVLAPCDPNAGIDGILGVIGGSVTVQVDGTVALNPAVIVGNRLSFSVPASDFAYVSSATGVATVGAATGVVTGVSAGSADISITYTVGEQSYTDTVAVEVTST